MYTLISAIQMSRWDAFASPPPVIAAPARAGAETLTWLTPPGSPTTE
jgi:hypothetical protein